MYVPDSYSVDNQPAIADFIRANSFATVVSQGESEPFASHIPLLLEETPEEHGRLIGHMAKANPQWKQSDGKTVLCIFQGPHAYISPSWYQSENVVPTWNYTAVHAYGTMCIETDPQVIREIVKRYVLLYEASMPAPWDIDSQDSVFIEKLSQAVVRFKISIDRVEGQWKLSQNHSADRRQKVIAELEGRNDGHDAQVAELMRQHLAIEDDANDGTS